MRPGSAGFACLLAAAGTDGSPGRRPSHFVSYSHDRASPMQIQSDSGAQRDPQQAFPTLYHAVHWDSVNRVKDYLYQQLAPLLDDALERLESADRAEIARGRTALVPVVQRLALARNALAAWAALITVESGGMVPEAKRLPLAPAMLPAWLLDYVRARTTLLVDYTRPVYVHAEVFYETLVLFSQVGDEIGALLSITLADAAELPRGVWLRAVFVPPPPGPYSSISTMLNALASRRDTDDIAFRLKFAASLLKINESRLVLQNNRKTGEQALAALLPTLTADDLRAAHGDARRQRLRLVRIAAPAGSLDAASSPRLTPLQPPVDPDDSASAQPGRTGPLGPFWLDDEPAADPGTPVPAFPPGALETWLDDDLLEAANGDPPQGDGLSPPAQP